MSHRTAARLSQFARAAGDHPGTDAELVGRFAAGRDEAAFAALVDRHGPMVLGVCRRMLGDHHLAEDAAQAAFLALARSAGRVRDPGAVAAWLYGAAVRVSLKARRAATRSRDADPRPNPSHADPLAEITGRDLARAVDEEVARLPDRERAAVVLCCLDGLPQPEAAGRLGCSPGVVRGLLDRGRARLRRRLERRGIALSTALALLAAGGSAALPPHLGERIARLAVGGPVPRSVAALAVGGSGATRLVAATVLAIAGAAGLAAFGGRQSPPTDPPSDPPAVAPAAARVDRAGDPLPAGTIGRLGTVRQRHGRALAVWFAPGGKTVHAFGDGPAVRTWDAATGKLLDTKVLAVDYRADMRVNELGTAHIGYDHDFGNAVSADGRVLATRPNGTGRVRFHDLATGRLISEVKVAPDSYVRESAISADGGTYVACENITGGGDRPYDLRAYDVKAGTARALFKTKDPFHALFLTPDGKRAVLVRSSFRDADSIECWDVRAGKRDWGLKDPVVSAGLSDDGRTVVGVAFTAGVRAWDVGTGEAATRFRLPTMPDFKALGFPMSVDAMRVGLHGTTLTLTSSAERLVWDAAAGKLAGRLPGGYGPVAASPDGQSLVTAGDTLQRWDTATGRPAWADTRADGHGGQVRSVRFAAGGSVLLSTGCDETVRVWDVKAGAGRVLVRHESSYGLPAAPTPDGRHVLLLKEQGAAPAALAITELATGTGARLLQTADAAEGSRMYPNLSAAAVAPDGRTAVGVLTVGTADGSGTRKVTARWDLSTGRYQGRVTIPGGLSYDVIAPDGNTAVVYDQLVDLATGSERKLKLERDEHMAFAAAVSPDGRLAVAIAVKWETGPDSPVRLIPRSRGLVVFDAASGQAVDRIADVPVGRVLFTPDGRGVVVADTAGIGVWDLRMKKRVVWHAAHDRTPGDFGRSFVSCWDVTPDGRTLATGHPDGTVLLWDLGTPAAPAVGKSLTPERLAKLWDALAAADSAKAYAAGWELDASPAQTVELLKARVRPAAPADRATVDKLVGQLDAPSFADREAAERDLKTLGPPAGPALRAAIQASGGSPERRERIDRVLKAIGAPRAPDPADQPGLRAVGVLERLGTPAARTLLTELAAGVPDARLTREATAALARLQSR